MSKIIDLQTGEVLSLVLEKEGTWFKVEGADHDHIAEILNVAGIQEKRKRTHRLDRQIHAESLKRGR